MSAQDPNNAYFWLNWLPQIAIAIGTFLAVIVALFGDAIRGKLYPPLLRLRLLAPEGERATVKITPPPNDQSEPRKEDARAYFVNVSNDRRWSAAQQVQVFVTRVEEPGADEQFTTVWVGEAPILWRNQVGGVVARAIGASADVCLCTVVKGKWIELQPIVMPFNFPSRRREPTRFRATLEARSIQVDSDPLRVEISWDGEWHNGEKEMRLHVVVKVI